MTTSNTTDNPIFRAARAAVAELTTPEAWHWYGRQLQNGAAITYRGLVMVQHWMRSSQGQTAAIEPAQAKTTDPESPLMESPAPEQTDTPAVWTALEANGGAVHEPVQVIATPEVSSEATDLGQSTLSVADQTEGNDGAMASTEDQRLEDSHDLTMVTEEDPLRDNAIPFSDDELECGPPFLEEEEDTSFFSPEEDEDTDRLLYEDTEPDPSTTTSDLSAMIQAYMRQKRGDSDEQVASEAIAHTSPSETAAVAWEEHQVVSDSAARD
jgi:hypothetical protein